MGVSNDAATAAGCSNRVEHNFGDLADGVGQLGGTGSGRGSEEGPAYPGALHLLGDDCDDGREEVVAAESGACRGSI